MGLSNPFRRKSRRLPLAEIDGTQTEADLIEASQTNDDENQDVDRIQPNHSLFQHEQEQDDLEPPLVFTDTRENQGNAYREELDGKHIIVDHSSSKKALPNSLDPPLSSSKVSPFSRTNDQILTEGTILRVHYDSAAKKRNEAQSTTCDIRLDMDCMQIIYTYARGADISHTIDVANIREIRKKELALKTKGFRVAIQAQGEIPNPEFAFTIIHGKSFNPHQFCLVGLVEDDFTAWANGLMSKTPLNAPRLYRYHLQIKHYLAKAWDNISPNNNPINMRQIKNWLRLIHCRMSNTELKDNFAEFAVEDIRTGESVFEFDCFCQFYHSLNQNVAFNVARSFSSSILATMENVNRTKQLHNKRHHLEYTSSSNSHLNHHHGIGFVDDDPEQEMLLAENYIINFHTTEQNDLNFSEEQAAAIVNDFASPIGFTLSNFIQFLLSKENTIFNPDHLERYQDMTQPLAHYWINSSHNTFLMAGQAFGESSVEGYIRSLRKGCRCVEIDTWDVKHPAKVPVEERIIVYHGNTLTTKILFKDVLSAINDHAFATTDFPLILSIENHCCIEQQKTMAKLFVETFGDRLLTTDVSRVDDHANGVADAYPSPHQLKNRVIVKFKKLKEGQSEAEYDSHNEEDISSSLKNGILKMEEEEGKWKSYFFSLTQDKLSFADAHCDIIRHERHELDDDECDDENDSDSFTTKSNGAAALDQDADSSEKEELHYSETWFHGHLSRLEAQQLICKHRDTLASVKRRDGVFLVRHSSTYKGDYTLSLWSPHHLSIKHCHIYCKESKYFVDRFVSFKNLYELVEYYQCSKLQALDLSVVLREPVPQLAAHTDKSWYHADITRAIAEEWLRHIPIDGAFLIRESTCTTSSASISFRGGSIVRHCRVAKDGRMYCIGDMEFESLVELVDYYSGHTLFRDTKLTEPVDLLLLNRYGIVTADLSLPVSPQRLDVGWYKQRQQPLGFEATPPDRFHQIPPRKASLVIDSLDTIEEQRHWCDEQDNGPKSTLHSTTVMNLLGSVGYTSQNESTDEIRARTENDTAQPRLTKLYASVVDVDGEARENVRNHQYGTVCVTLCPHTASKPDELSFSAGCVITNVHKRDDCGDGSWWQGDYGSIQQGWFPSNYVEDIDHYHKHLKTQSSLNSNWDGSHDDLRSMPVDGLHVDILPSTDSMPLRLKISNFKTQHYIDVGIANETEMEQWHDGITLAASRQRQRTASCENLQRTMKIAKEFSDIVFYCQSVKFQNFEESKKAAYQHMSSFKEQVAITICGENKSNSKATPELMNQYNCRQISRVYPKGTRINSTNYDPQPLWNCGVQMAALNFQTPDRPMWLNHGKFRQNGGCGYVLKPDVMRLTKQDGLFNPLNISTYNTKVVPLTLSLRIVCGYHLYQAFGRHKGMLSPYVEVEIVGVPSDRHKYKTKVIPNNGFNPVWEEEHCTFEVSFPELACLCITVYDLDSFGEAAAVAHCIVPIGSHVNPSLRQGWRSIPLRCRHDHALELASLLVHCNPKYHSIPTLTTIAAANTNNKSAATS